MGIWDVTGSILETIAYGVYKIMKVTDGNEEVVYCSIIPPGTIGHLGKKFSWTVIDGRIEQLTHDINELDFLNRGYKFLRKYYCKEACVCFSFFEENCDYTDDSSFDLTRELYDKIEDAIKKLISDESFEDAIELYSYLIKNEYPATGDYGAYIKMYIGRADLYCKIKNYDAALKDYGTAIEKYAHRGGLSESFTREDFAYCCKKKGDIHQKFAGIAYIEEALVLGGTDILGIAREVMPLAEKFKKEKDFENEYKAYEAILSGAYEYDEADKDLVDDVRKRMKIVKKKIVE